MLPILRWLGFFACRQVEHRVLKSLLNLIAVRRISVRLAGPEKSLQTILLAARNDVHVQVEHALADAIVNGNKRSLRLQTLLNSL